MISASNISFQYNTNSSFTFPDIQLSAGEELLILGKSGSGKTTLLNILAGLLAPQAGEVTIAGQNLYQLTGTKRDKFRGSHIGLVFQKPHILGPLTVRENLDLAQYFSGQKESSLIPKVLEELGIGEKINSQPQHLSEGEAQRVSIARAVVIRPKLILADEPTASLDDENAFKVISLLKDQARKLKAALIIVTHDQRVKDLILNHISMGGAS
ncbi:ABC transporter ATP-binding protein [Echinicola pacifica]|uniref:ABC transporter ATP-binding protein n=1 Tax=Echinicola pacifica TaxID=346377 RepID=A0A918UW54_9BACT|nr:ATP-binding cassette domain-containing protein [Echinicola pacifica]GGZ39820.1 ABC transporter ATP-binding protein [Echinicola pacifica]